MQISISDAKGQLVELVRRAESGEEIILTRHGQPVVHLVPIAIRPAAESRRKLLKSLNRKGAAKAFAGPTAASSQDFLYDEAGCPDDRRGILEAKPGEGRE